MIGGIGAGVVWLANLNNMVVRELQDGAELMHIKLEIEVCPMMPK
jgi:hypothetical protein